MHTSKSPRPHIFPLVFAALALFALDLRGATSTVTAATGQTISFSVTAAGTAPFTYRWYRNSVAIAGATSATYMQSNLALDSAASFYAVVTNSKGSATSNVIALTVTAPVAPAFTVQPASKVVTAGAAVTFSATATGSPAPTYQWKFRGVNIAGATAGSFSIPAALAVNAGPYTVTATNVAGTVTSTAASLAVNTVSAGPAFTARPAGQTVYRGASFTLSSAASGSPTYQWWKGSVKIPGATAATYSVVSAAASDSGAYTVTASNAQGTVSASAVTVVVLDAAADFNNDQQSDLVFQNRESGAGGLWLMNRTSITATVALPSPGNGWQMVGTAALNTQGQADVLWQNAATGEVDAELLSGQRVTGVVKLCTLAANWRVVGAADFNDDGRVDLLVQNSATREVGTWLMNGTTPTGYLKITTLASGWQAVGGGDFNSDGLADLVVQNPATTEVGVWLLNDTTPVRYVKVGMAGTNWGVVGVGDFNADGLTDIVFQNAVTGQTGTWLMDDTTQVGWISITTAPAVRVSNH